MAWIDLTRVIYSGMPKIPILPEVEVRQVFSLARGNPLNVTELKAPCHAGTHIDAPLHIVAGGKAITDIPLEHCTGEAVVVSVRRGGGEPIAAADLQAGPPVHAGDILFIHTGWDRTFGTPEYDMHPHLAEEAAEWIVRTGIKMVGVDCITVDIPVSMRPQGFTFPVHRILLGNEVLIVENLANLDQVAGRRVKVYAFPLPVQGSDAGHARIVAEVA